jgi:hypothetical protein
LWEDVAGNLVGEERKIRFSSTLLDRLSAH